MNGLEKLQDDLNILGRFADVIPAYLRGDVLFRPMGPTLPQFTFGGFLMRQYRLLLLRNLLSQAEQNKLDSAVAKFQMALDGNIVKFEQKALKELGARYRQWSNYLGDLSRDKSQFSYYGTNVEARVMLDVLNEQLSMPPYRNTSDIPARLGALDKMQRARWVKSEFVWHEEWQEAYPEEDYWYLYGYAA